MSDVLAKGVNFLYGKRFIESQYGTGTWEKILDLLPQKDKDIWSGGILVNQSYPFETFKAMVATLTREVRAVKDQELVRMYEFIADQSLNKVYKIFFKFTYPSFVIKNYPKLWDNFFNTGNVEVPVSEKGHAMLKFILPEIFLDWLTPACTGYSKKAVEISGGRNLSLKEVSRKQLGTDQWEIVYELNWVE